MSDSFAMVLGVLSITYLVVGPILAVWALVEIGDLRVRVDGHDALFTAVEHDLDVLFDDDDPDPDGGDEAPEVEPSNVVAFGRRIAS